MAFAACPAGFIVWDSGYRIIDWNPAAERIFGWTRAEAMAQPRRIFWCPKTSGLYVEGVFVQLLEAEEPTDSLNDNITRDGRVIHCEWHNIPMRDRAGARLRGSCPSCRTSPPGSRRRQRFKPRSWSGNGRRSELESVLTQSEQIIASITSILITVDENGLITTWNAAAAAAFGLRTSEALGRRFTECGIGWDWAVVLDGAAQCTARAEAGAAGRRPLCDSRRQGAVSRRDAEPDQPLQRRAEGVPAAGCRHHGAPRAGKPAGPRPEDGVHRAARGGHRA